MFGSKALSRLLEVLTSCIIAYIGDSYLVDFSGTHDDEIVSRQELRPLSLSRKVFLNDFSAESVTVHK